MKKLKIHFELESFDCHGVNNFFAMLFASSIFAYSVYFPPATFLSLPEWWVFIAAGFGVALLFVSIRIYYFEAVKAGRRLWPVMVNFALYIALTCLLTFGFGILRVHSTHLRITATVTVSENSELSVNNAEFSITGKGGNPILTTITNKSGHFDFFCRKDLLEETTNVVKCTWTHDDSDQYEFKLSNAPRDTLPLLLENMKLNKCPKKASRSD